MNEYDLLLFFCLLFASLQFSLYHDRLKALESKLDTLIKHHNIELDGFPEPSSEVLQLLSHEQTRVKALKLYRKQTGLGLKDAKKVVDSFIP